MSNIESLHTKRLILRPPQLTDAPDIQKQINDWEVVKFLSNQIPWPYPDTGAIDFIKKVVHPNQGKDNWFWAICIKEKPDTAIGLVELWRDGSPEHRGFWLAKKYWGRGFMPEATKAINSFAFEKLGFEKLILSNAKENVASRRVKEKTGARFLRFSKNIFVGEIERETELWEIKKEDWLRHNLRDY